MRGLDPLDKFSVAVICHADYIRPDFLYKGDGLTDLCDGKSAPCLVSLGALDGDEADPAFRISLEKGAEGHVKMSPRVEFLKEGQSTVLTAEPAPGSVLAGWRYPNGRIVRGKASLTVGSHYPEVTYTALFRRPENCAAPELQLPEREVVWRGWRRAELALRVNADAYPVTFGCKGLPPGMHLASRTAGVISGTPQSNGVWRVEVTAKGVGRAQPAAKAGRYSFSFVSEPDQGQTDAINKGLRRATGDVVAWLNADEWYEPGALSKMALAFESRPKADLIYGEVRFVRPDGSTIRVKRDHRFSGFVLLWYGCYISSAATFWRRRVLDASYKVCMDFEYWVRLWRHGYRFSFLPATLASFTWHDGNVSEVFATRRREERNKVQDLYASTILRTGNGKARFAEILRILARQIHRALVVERLLRKIFQCSK